MIKKLLVFFTIRKLFIYLALLLAINFVPASDRLYSFDFDSKYQKTTSPLIWSWSNFDGSYYLAIADRGYFRNEQPFFPFYPYLIRKAHFLTGFSYVVSGQIVSMISFFLAFILLYELLKLDGKQTLINSFILIFLIFPTSFYLSAIYNDSIYLLLSTATIYLARKRHWLLAGVYGAAATLARLNGLALIFIVGVEYFFASTSVEEVSSQWEFVKFPFKKFWQKLSLTKLFSDSIYAILFIPIAFLGYLAYVQYKFDSWTTLFSSMHSWGQDRVVLPPQVVWRYIKIIFLYPTFKLNYWIAVLELAAVVLYLVLLLFSYKKIRLSYWLFFAISILIPAMTGTFQGMPRYGLHLYPFWLALSMLFDKFPVRVRYLYIVLSCLLLVILLSLFTRGYFVA